MPRPPLADDSAIPFGTGSETGHLRHMPRPRVSALSHVAPPPRRVSCPPVRTLCLSDALVHGGTVTLLTTAAETPADRQDTGRGGPPPAIEAQSGTGALDRAIMGCDPQSHDWATFLLEILPRTALAANTAPQGTPILIGADLPAPQRQALRDLLPGHPLHDLAPDEAIHVGQLHSAEAGGFAGCSLSWQGLAPLTELRTRSLQPPPTEGARRVLLWSAQVPHRLRNAYDLRQRLEDQGFVTIETDALSLCDRLRALALARDIVAPDDASLADSLLAPEGARIFALTPTGADLHRWSMMGALTGHQVTTVLGSAPYHRLRRRLLPRGLRGERVFHVDPHLLLPFFASDARDPGALPLSRLLDRLHAASSEADVLTGAWAVLSEATPSGFEARLRDLRHRAALAGASAEAGALEGLLAHPFLADFGRATRSGFPVLGGFTDWEAAVAAQLRRSFAGQDPGPGPLAAEALAGETGARRRVLLGMLLLPSWQVALPDLSGACGADGPEDVLERHLSWAMCPPALIRAGEDAAWVAHVERLLHWLADRLEAEDLSPALRLRLQRMAGRLDLGQLLLVDQPLRGVHAARNRVLARVAVGGVEKARPLRGNPVQRLRETLSFYRERLRLAWATSQRRILPFLLAMARRGVHAARNRVLARVAVGGVVAASGSGSLEGPLGGSFPGGRRVRVGVLCRTFDKGPDSEAVLGFFTGFDPARFEIFAYSIGFHDRVVSRDPGFARTFDATIPHRRDLPGDPAGIRAALLADRLDVFLYANATTYGLQPLDLALYHRVAPVQAVLNSHVPMPLGYPSFDALLTGQSDDPACELAQEEGSERLIRLPGPVINYLTTLEPRPDPPLDRAALGLAPEDVVLMNAGSSMKLRHETLATMMRAVAGVPRGILLLAPYNPGWAARAMAFTFNRQIAETAAEVGLDPARVRVLGELSVAEAEAALACADLYLNPFPHGGATMTHLALIHGIPPVTLRRRSTRSIDQFLVASHGFAELLADTPEDYIALAQSLGTDPARRADIRARLKQAARTPGFVANPDHARAMQKAVEDLVGKDWEG